MTRMTHGNDTWDQVFMLSDKSPGFEDTRDFVKRRVAEAYALLDQKASPLGADSMDARVDALCSALPVPPQVKPLR